MCRRKEEKEDYGVCNKCGTPLGTNRRHFCNACHCCWNCCVCTPFEGP